MGFVRTCVWVVIGLRWVWLSLSDSSWVSSFMRFSLLGFRAPRIQRSGLGAAVGSFWGSWYGSVEFTESKISACVWVSFCLVRLCWSDWDFSCVFHCVFRSWSSFSVFCHSVSWSVVRRTQTDWRGVLVWDLSGYCDGYPPLWVMRCGDSVVVWSDISIFLSWRQWCRLLANQH